VVERCDSCPVTKIEQVRATTFAGRLLTRIWDLDFDSKHIRFGSDEVTEEEIMGLRILAQERVKYEKEVWEERQRQAEMERRMRGGR
jgi:hypothetical protein